MSGLRLRRLAAGALGTVLLLAWPLATGASAQNLTVQITSPGEGETVRTTSVTVTGRVGTALLTSVDRIRVELRRSADGAVLDDQVLCAPCGQGANVPFEYDTPALDRNGPYTVRVEASGFFLATGIRVPDAVAERTFRVGVPPAAPTGLRAQRSDDRTVTLSWNAVPRYPDLAGYAVYRAVGNGDLKLLAASQTTSYVDSQTALVGGTFRYQVSAVRHGPSGNSSEGNDWLESRSNEATVDVPAPPGSSSVPQDGGGGTGQAPTGGGVGNIDLSSVFSRSPSLPSGGLSLPAPPTTVDTGFSTNLPFTDLPSGAQTAESRQAGRPQGGAAGDDREPGEPDGLSETNRRALLVPVATGSVLCVAALHMRWLSRRLAAPPLEALGTGPVDLEHDVPQLEPDFGGDFGDLDAGAPDRQPVGAGRS